MRKHGKNTWRSLPFIRLLAALISGILVGRYLSVPVIWLISTVGVTLVSLAATRLMSFTGKFAWHWLRGILLNVSMICIGALLFYSNDGGRDEHCVRNYLNREQTFQVSLLETPVERPRSWKLFVRIEAIWQKEKWQPVKGNVFLYLKKKPPPVLGYGSRLLLHTKLQPITNTGNPGAFDYRNYCATQDTWGQAFVQPKDWMLLPGTGGNRFTGMLLHTRENVLAILKKHIPGEKESGVAEALLIGYRNDLDKDLVRAYSNTGVVHIIAISGLHLGMVYGLILLLLRPFRRTKWIRWVKPVIVLMVLWGFSLLTGAAASILRSAVMFSFIVIGESIGRRGQTLNTLAASAFCLLWYDPYFLWDAGFQLSYAAVTSILLFQQPIYRKIYCHNKLLDHVWQLNSVSLSAQILTLPIILYYFHQFPNLFLFTNFIAVPLSGLILYAELFLLVCYTIPWLNLVCGKLISFLIAQMNGSIERTDRLPSAVTDGIRMNLLHTLLLYLVLAALTIWLMRKKTSSLIAALCISTLLVFFYMVAAVQQGKQHALLVYNIPKQTAIDIFEGHEYSFLGNTSLLSHAPTRNMYLQPARILHGAHQTILHQTILRQHSIQTAHRSVVIIDRNLSLNPVSRKITVDAVIISGNPRLQISQLAALFNCGQYVFDSSNPLWKIRQWKTQADSLHLRHHSVPEQGAFEMAL